MMKFIASTIVASAALATSAAALESAGWSVENLADEIEGAKEISAILQANELSEPMWAAARMWRMTASGTDFTLWGGGSCFE